MPPPTRTIWTFSCGHEFCLIDQPRGLNTLSATLTAPKTSSDQCPECRERFIQVVATEAGKREHIQSLKSTLSAHKYHADFVREQCFGRAGENDEELRIHFQRCLHDEYVIVAEKTKELLVAEFGRGGTEKTHFFLWASADGDAALEALSEFIDDICAGAQVEKLRARNSGVASSVLTAWNTVAQDLVRVRGDKKSAAFDKNVEKVVEKVVKLAEKDLTKTKK